MPALFAIKDYIKDAYYHIFNRGVDKRKIFLDKEDYHFFLYLLYKYLDKPKDSPFKGQSFRRTVLPLNLQNLHKEINLLAFSLMPNHFHLLLQQLTKEAMTKLLRAVCTTFSMYFNKKYKRSGTLFQGRYKAIIAYRDEDILNVANYIHLNSLELIPANISREEAFKRLVDYPWSSLNYYLGKKDDFWVKTEEVLKIAGGQDKYENLVKKQIVNPEAFSEYLTSHKLL